MGLLALAAAALLAADGGVVVICSDCRGRPIVQPHFEHGSARLLPSEAKLLDELARLLTEDPGIERLGVEGHAAPGEPRGAALSLSRAQAVVEALVSRGVDASRLEPHGAGSARPLTDNRTPVSKQKNRRVELVVYRRDGEEIAKWSAPP